MREKDAQKIMKELREDYNLVASSFASTRDRLWPEMKFLFDYAKRGERVLDVGCGNGRFCEYLKEARYIGVDFSEGMIKEAQKRYPEKDFYVASVLSLPFKDNFFSKVYGIAVIHQLPSFQKRKEALLEIKRVLRPGGRVFLTVWNLDKGSFFLIKNALRNLFTPLGPRDFILKRRRYYYIFKKGELSRLCREAGFSVQEEGEIKKGRESNFYVVGVKEEN